MRILEVDSAFNTVLSFIPELNSKIAVAGVIDRQ